MQKKNVVLLGDSIRLMGYGKLVPELLGEGYDVWQPDDNGRFVSYVLRQIFDYREQIDKADVVHFNAGEWDICDLFGDEPFTPEEFYTSQILRIARILQSRGKKVIFATTTPVRAENPHNRTDVIERYNSEAQRDGRGGQRPVRGGGGGRVLKRVRRYHSPVGAGRKTVRREHGRSHTPGVRSINGKF